MHRSAAMFQSSDFFFVEFESRLSGTSVRSFLRTDVVIQTAFLLVNIVSVFKMYEYLWSGSPIL